MASLSLFHLRAIFYGANIGIYFISPQNQLYFFSPRNEFQDHFYPHTKKTPTSASHCSATNRAPPEVRKRSGSGRSARRVPRRNRAAQSQSRPCARSRNDVQTEKRRSKRLRPWAFFRLIGELFADRPHRVPPHADARSKSGETGEKTLSRTRAHHRVSVFRLHPSAVIRWFTTRYG